MTKSLTVAGVQLLGLIGLSSLQLVGCSLGEPAEPGAGQIGEPSAGFVAQRLRRPGSRELAQSIQDLTGIAVSDARVAPLFTRRKYDNGDPDAWVTSDVLAATEELAWFVADEVVRTRPRQVLASCDSADACKLQLLGTLLPRIYRRALSPAEAASYAKLWDDAAKDSTDDAIRTVVAAALQSPSLLYREEVGTRLGDFPVAVLEPREIATQLSYLVTGSVPDDELLAVASDPALPPRLLDPEERLAQVTRLSRTPAAAALERHFFELYLATAEVSEMKKSPKVYPDYKGGAPLAAELAAMLDDVVRAGGSTRELLSRDYSMGAPLEASYGGGPPIRGVLMHPAFLAAFGGFENSNPIARGLFVLTNLLCAPPPPPPAGIPRAPSATSTAKTTRGKFAEHSRGSCQGCHKAIDGIGFGFEEFDGAGKFRSQENGVAIDATGLLPADGNAITYDGVGELSAHLAKSQQVADCFARHFVRFALGAGERTEDIPLYQTLSRGSTADTTYEARIRALVASDAFVRRRVQ